MALGFRLKSETQLSQEKALKVELVLLTSNTVSPWTQTQTPLGPICHSVTAHKASCRNLDTQCWDCQRRHKLLTYFFSHLDVGGKLSIPWLTLVHLHFIRHHQNPEIHNGVGRLTTKIGLWLIHCNVRTACSNVLRKKGRGDIAMSSTSILLRLLPVEKLNS